MRHTEGRRRNNKGDIIKATGNSSRFVFYATTANEFIIRRRFEALLKKTKETSQDRIRVLGKEIRSLSTLLSQTHSQTNQGASSQEGSGQKTECHRLVRIQKIRNRLLAKKKELSLCEKAPTSVLRRYKQIRTFGQLGTLIMSNNIRSFAPKHYPVDPADCSNCEKGYTFNPKTYLSTCQSCCRVVYSIFNQEDYSHEVIANKLYSKNSSVCCDHDLRDVTFTDGKQKVTVQNADNSAYQVRMAASRNRSSDASWATGTGQTRNSSSVLRDSDAKKDQGKLSSVENILKSNTTLASQAANRSTQFRRYLSQFLEDSPAVPQDIFEYLFTHFKHNHLHPMVRCKPTPVASVLKCSPFRDFCYMNVKISRMYDGLEVPVISQKLLEEMVERYNIIIHLDLGEFYKQKLNSFEFVAALIFFALGRFDLCKLIQQNKNRRFFDFEDEAVQFIVAKAKEANDTIDWSRLTDLVPVSSIH
jgi:hypothetical protein